MERAPSKNDGTRVRSSRCLRPTCGPCNNTGCRLDTVAGSQDSVRRTTASRSRRGTVSAAAAVDESEAATRNRGV